MKNIKGKPITYNDWIRVAKRYGDEKAVEHIKEFAIFGLDSEVDWSEQKLFNELFKNG